MNVEKRIVRERKRRTIKEVAIMTGLSLRQVYHRARYIARKYPDVREEFVEHRHYNLTVKAVSLITKKYDNLKASAGRMVTI